jgi:hypothetical protein
MDFQLKTTKKRQGRLDDHRGQLRKNENKPKHIIKAIK